MSTEKQSAALARAREARRSLGSVTMTEQIRIALEKVPQDVRAAVSDKLAEIPGEYKLVYLKGMTGKSLRGAVNANCAECMCWKRAEVGRCRISTCPFFALRPWKGKR